MSYVDIGVMIAPGEGVLVNKVYTVCVFHGVVECRNWV